MSHTASEEQVWRDGDAFDVDYAHAFDSSWARLERIAQLPETRVMVGVDDPAVGRRSFFVQLLAGQAHVALVVWRVVGQEVCAYASQERPRKLEQRRHDDSKHEPTVRLFLQFFYVFQQQPSQSRRTSHTHATKTYN